MKTPTYLFSLILVIAAAAESPRSEKTIDGSKAERTNPMIAEALRSPVTMAGPLADAFKAALHAEEVERDLASAATQYKAIVEKIRARDDDWGAGGAALSLFRLAEIRRRQGNEEEARTLYEQVTNEFEDWEPMVSLSRQQLGLDPSDFFPQVKRIENDRSLAEKVERSSWEVRTRVSNDKFALVTFEVKPKEDAAPYEGMPEAYEIQTLHYVPIGPLKGIISSTCVKGEAVRKGKFFGAPIAGTLVTRVTGFGHSYDVPGGLRRNVVFSMASSDWTGLRGASADAIVGLTFHDEMDDKSKGLAVNFKLETISEAKARTLAEPRSLEFPTLEEQGWSLTLPPAPDEFEKAHQGE